MKVGMIVISDPKGEDLRYVETLYYIKFFPYSVEYSESLGLFQMVGSSPFFEEIEEGEDPPFYELIVSDLANGKQMVLVKKAKI